MARDRRTYFSEPKFPSKEEVRLMLEDFIGDAGWVHNGTDFLCVELNSRPSTALRRMRGVSPGGLSRQEGIKLRVFEIDIKSLNDPRPSLSVMTRSGDEFTSSLADGFSEIVTRWWGGIREEE